jgi:hypothetical protein
MPNDISAVVPRILAEGVVAIRENSVMTRLVRSDFGREAMQKGQSVDVPIPSPMGIAGDVLPSPVFGAATDLTPRFVPINLNRWKEAKFSLSDREIGQIMEGGIMPMQVSEAARTLGNAMDSDLLNLYKGVWGVAGTAGVTPFQDGSGIVNAGVQYGVNTSKDARKVLNRQLCPKENRRIVLDVEAEANASALPQFINAQASADAGVVTNGEIGVKQGFLWAMDQNVGRHTTGATGAYLFTINAAAGATTIAVGNGTGVPAEGDVFFIPGQTQPYVIRAGSTNSSWLIAPGLRAPVTTNTLIALVASHTPNLAFNRDAFAIAVRPFDDVLTPGSIVQTFVDDVTGLPLRLEITRQNKQTQYSFDVLYGVALIRPELACRILGQ